MKVVRVQKGAPQAFRQPFAEGRFAGTRDPTDDPYRHGDSLMWKLYLQRVSSHTQACALEA
jgi:hypothetical protein